MAADNSKLTGTERAAILLMTLGEQNAAQVLRELGPKEVQKVGSAMASVASVSKDHVNVVLEKFITTVDEQTSLGVGTEEYIKKVLIDALGEDKASGMIDRILMGRNSKGLEALKWMEPRSVAEIIRQEHPQIIAIVLSYLDPDLGAEVLGMLPERTRPDIVMRIASLDGIQPNALIELDEIMEKQFSSNNSVKSSTMGGTKKAADILNFLDRSMESEIMDAVKEVDGELGTVIEEHMFVFENLGDVDDRSIQTLLREVSSDSLLLAMKGADEHVETCSRNVARRLGGERSGQTLRSRGRAKRNLGYCAAFG
jgi:flagellar motor switch protein FliG